MMTAKVQSDFLPLFGAWFDTANLAQSADAQALASDAGNLLADLDLSAMVEAETTLLSHTPSSATEAACLLEIIRQNIADSGRSDGMDVRALGAVQAWLASQTSADATLNGVDRLLHEARARG